MINITVKRQGSIMVFCDKEFIGKKIKEFRKTALLTQAQLAEKTGISETHMSKIETGSNAPTVENFLKIAEVLNFSLEEFGINTEHKSSDIRKKFIKYIYENPNNKLEFYYKLMLELDKFKENKN